MAIRNFVWTGSVTLKKPIQVSWSVCCSSVGAGGLGFKSLCLLNEALFCKFVWRLLNQDSLVLTFLKNRFLHKLVTGNRFYLGSSVWPFLRAGYDKIMHHCKWIVGLNSKVRFWKDRWLEEPLLDLVDTSDISWDLDMPVSAFMTLDGIWNIPLDFRIKFPDLADRIAMVHVANLEDRLVWMPDPSGVITCKNYYKFLTNEPAVRVPWTRFIWSRSIPPSKSAICWRLLHNRIPTDDRFCRIGYSVVSCCSLCGLACEDAVHLFLSCRYARKIWFFVGYLFDILIPHSDTVLDFFNWCLGVSFSSQLKNLWQSAVVAGVAAIWAARNAIRFTGKNRGYYNSVFYIKKVIFDAGRLGIGHMDNSVADLLILKRLGVRGVPSKGPKVITVHWLAPSPGWVKINTDGAALGSPGMAGCGGVFRNSRGFVKGCFYANLGIMTSFEAELWGVIKALLFAKQFGWHFLWLECDSSSVVQLLLRRSMLVPWRLLAVWSIVLHFISTISFKVSHIYREGNGVADALSKMALNANGDIWLPNLPSSCLHAHGMDMWGDRSFRFC